MTDEVAAAVLAAGRGSRFGGHRPKCLEEWRGRTLVAWALEAAVSSGLFPVLLVTGYERRLVEAAAPAGVDLVHSSRWRSGIAHSLRAALAALDGYASVRAVCVGLADQPRWAPRRTGAWPRRSRRAPSSRSPRTTGSGAIRCSWRVASGAKRTSSPVMSAPRALMERHPVVEVPCDDTGSAVDVDTPADLTELDNTSTEQESQ